MIDSIRNKLQANLADYVMGRFMRIEVEPMRGMFNYRCFDNSVQYQHEFPETSVIEVIYLHDDTPILHYINYDPVSKKYLETTKGHQAKHFKYYYIREVPADEYDYIGSMFDKAVDSWTRQFSNWFHRNILGIKRLV